jgi:hypothetical protein
MSREVKDAIAWNNERNYLRRGVERFVVASILVVEFVLVKKEKR